MTRSVRLDLTYHSYPLDAPRHEGFFYSEHSQAAIFECSARYVVAPCGRRYGKTEGAFRRMVHCCVRPEKTLGLKKAKQLWVDVTQGNIERYFGVYLEPILKPIEDFYRWNKQLKILSFRNGSVVHFGSAEKPENLEGFGYDVVWLNEAGHILGGPKGERLWSHTILPMTMEGRGGKGAQVFLLGTPKDIQYGPGLFRKLAERGEDPENTDIRTFRRSSYDNPRLTQELINEIFEEIRPNEVRQEVYGEFEDQAGRNMVIPYQVASEALYRTVPEQDEYHVFWGLDVARGGADETALCKRRGRKVLEPVLTRHDLMDGNEVAAWVQREYDETPEDERPRYILVDEIGYGSAALDAGRKMGLPMRGVNVAHKPVSEEIYYRKRDELWFRGAKWCETGSLAGDDRLARELTLVGYGYMPSSQKRKVESKDELKRLGHSSPNRADAFLLTMDAGVELKPKRTGAYQLAYKRQRHATWMSA